VPRGLERYEDASVGAGTWTDALTRPARGSDSSARLVKRDRLVFYQNGEKQVDETYQFGMVTGLVENYYEDGKLLSEAELS
jgi:hypothetical protein